MADSTGTTVFALACHPDDIEFMMGGTLFLLKAAGCSLHYMNLANGCCGSTRYSRDQTARIRREEGRAAAQLLGAQFHESLTVKLFYVSFACWRSHVELWLRGAHLSCCRRHGLEEVISRPPGNR